MGRRPPRGRVYCSLVHSCSSDLCEYSVADLADVVPVALALPTDLCGLLLADDELLEVGKMLSLYLRKVLLVVREVVLKLEQGLGAGHLGVGPPAGWLEHV